MALLLTAVGCASVSLQKEVLTQQPEGLLVERVTGFSAPDKPPVAAELSAENLDGSLRRILVQYHGTVSFLRSDPVPLLTQDQAKAFSEILAKELPGLASNQRIRFSFKDFRKKNLNVMNVYRDGPYLVYDFELLVASPKYAMNANDPPFSEVTVAELPGQDVHSAYPKAVYKDPVHGTAEAKSAEMADKLALLAANRSDGSVTEEEAEHLRTLIKDHPETRVEAWRQYWDKRATLRKARAQGLMDDGAYKTQAARLEQELTP